jgi:hypothetical protein
MLHDESSTAIDNLGQSIRLGDIPRDRPGFSNRPYVETGILRELNLEAEGGESWVCLNK